MGEYIVVTVRTNSLLEVIGVDVSVYAGVAALIRDGSARRRATSTHLQNGADGEVDGYRMPPERHARSLPGTSCGIHSPCRPDRIRSS